MAEIRYVRIAYSSIRLRNVLRYLDTYQFVMSLFPFTVRFLETSDDRGGGYADPPPKDFLTLIPVTWQKTVGAPDG